MANQFTDLQIIECNRLHSEEAKSDNNENFALWQTNLQDIVHLDAGDKVSVHGAMVSERGAGQPSSLEIKGINLGFTKDFDFTTYEEKNASDFLASKYEIIECNASSKTISIRDDTLNFTTSYYINANGHNYMHLPRRWWYKEDSTLKLDLQWTDSDDLDAGLSYFNPFKDTFGFLDDYYQIIPTTTDYNASSKNFKPKNNNERYTILMRDKTFYSESSASGNLNASNVRDPENHIYRTFKQLKTINVPAGFNSPEYVANEITRQLQNIKEVKRYEFRDPIRDLPVNGSVPGFPIRMYDTIETETYKPFNVAYAYRGNQAAGPTSPSDFSGVKNDFNFYIDGGNDSSDNASGYEYLSQYHVVATKRPELYETGRLVNRYFTTYRGIFGSVMSGTSFGTGSEESRRLTISQTYTEENCRRWYEFFKAQELYPEIWNIFSDERTGYAEGDTIENSRWFHINRFENGSQTFESGTVTPNNNAMLGDSGYKLHSWNASNEKQPASAILPVYYKASDRDIFYENPQPDEYSFGCMKKSSNGRIDFTFTDNNGWDSAFMDMLLENATVSNILSLRKLGFDMHFSAPGMCYVLPYAGWSTQANSYSEETRSGYTEYGIYDLHSGYRTAGSDLGSNTLNSQLYRNKLYIGADSPLVEYDGTNFTISGLHTPINKGNSNIANNIFNASMPQFGATGGDTEGGDQVYVINPKELWNDWTPARKPYRPNAIKSASGGEPAANIARLNDNLEAWTIYDSLCGIFISDINLTESEWKGSLWDILGFSYNQFNSNTNSRLSRINNTNLNDLSIITTNAEVNQGDSKVYIQNLWGAPLYNNMIGGGGTIYDVLVNYYPEIKQKTTSVKITADNLPIRMIRGYYTIRSNILQETPFIGGKVNNTNMPIIGIVDKINGDGDFYFSQESSLQFTVTKPLRLASITCSLHDPDGSYARCTDQSAVLFKIEKTRNLTFDIAQELLEEQLQQKK
jgi:hypothetical protein